MKRPIRHFLVSAAVFSIGAGFLFAQSNAQSRILSYISDHLKPGQPVRVTELYNTVFTTPEDHKALNKLYKDFFRIPMFIVQYQQRFSKPPSLKTIAEQFSLDNPQEADTLLRVMETDPRVPKFITQDPKTGEISKVNVQMVRDDPQFAKGAVHQISGWEGRTAPSFDLERADGNHLSTTQLLGKVTLLYVWFTGCPPCMKEAPILAHLQHQYGATGFTVIGANADDMLGLTISEKARRHYATQEGISFPIVNWTQASNHAYGGIAIYPTLFLINRKGIIVAHWVGYTSPSQLRSAITKALAE